MKRCFALLLLCAPLSANAQPDWSGMDFRYVKTSGNGKDHFQKIIDVRGQQVTVNIAFQDNKTGTMEINERIELTYDCRNRQSFMSVGKEWSGWENVQFGSPMYKSWKQACDLVFEPTKSPPKGFPWLKNYITKRSRIVGRVTGLYCARDMGRLSENRIVSEIDRVISEDRLGEEEDWLFSYRGRQAMQVAYDHLLADCVTVKDQDAMGRAMLTWIK